MNRILQADVILTLTREQALYLVDGLQAASLNPLYTQQYRETVELVHSIVLGQVAKQGIEL